jgi:hypothetical protein
LGCVVKGITIIDKKGGKGEGEEGCGPVWIAHDHIRRLEMFAR